jgi:hypothetical protein
MDSGSFDRIIYYQGSHVLCDLRTKVVNGGGCTMQGRVLVSKYIPLFKNEEKVVGIYGTSFSGWMVRKPFEVSCIGSFTGRVLPCYNQYCKPLEGEVYTTYRTNHVSPTSFQSHKYQPWQSSVQCVHS